MWLRREHQREALFYWEQARHFFEATFQLPNTSAPLTTYYCFLNAAKALFRSRGVSSTEHHGVTGETTGRKTSLSSERVTFLQNGALATLCQLLGEPSANLTYSLKDLLYNLPYIHRAYNLTFASRPELFIGIDGGEFVRKAGSNEAWFRAGIKDERDATQHTINKLPSGYERDNGVSEFVIRLKSRFHWIPKASEREANLKRLTAYHKKVRKNVFYIHGPMRLWYIKRRNDRDGMIDRSSLTITFAAMHRLSELARYSPMLLARHFDCQHNWLLSEFIATARNQFLDEISSEITGKEFMIPGRKGVS